MWVQLQVEELEDFKTCDGHNLLVCSFATDADSCAVEAGAVATISTYTGSYDYAKVDTTYACTSDPLEQVKAFFPFPFEERANFCVRRASSCCLSSSLKSPPHSFTAPRFQLFSYFLSSTFFCSPFL